MSLVSDDDDHGRPHERHHAALGRVGTWTPPPLPAPCQLGHPGRREGPRRGYRGRGHGEHDGARERPRVDRRLLQLVADHSGWVGGVETARRPGVGGEGGTSQRSERPEKHTSSPVEIGDGTGGQGKRREQRLERKPAPPDLPSGLLLCMTANGGETRPP